MMIRVLLTGEAEEGEAPTIWRKDWTAIAVVVVQFVSGKRYKEVTTKRSDTLYTQEPLTIKVLFIDVDQLIKPRNAVGLDSVD